MILVNIKYFVSVHHIWQQCFHSWCRRLLGLAPWPKHLWHLWNSNKMGGIQNTECNWVKGNIFEAALQRGGSGYCRGSPHFTSVLHVLSSRSASTPVFTKTNPLSTGRRPYWFPCFHVENLQHRCKVRWTSIVTAAPSLQRCSTSRFVWITARLTRRRHSS